MFNFKGIPSFLGVAVFSAEGASVVLHLRDSMKKPEKFIKIFVYIVLSLNILFIIFCVTNILTFG